MQSKELSDLISFINLCIISPLLSARYVSESIKRRLAISASQGEFVIDAAFVVCGLAVTDNNIEAIVAQSDFGRVSGAVVALLRLSEDSDRRLAFLGNQESCIAPNGRSAICGSVSRCILE